MIVIFFRGNPRGGGFLIKYVCFSFIEGTSREQGPIYNDTGYPGNLNLNVEDTVVFQTQKLYFPPSFSIASVEKEMSKSVSQRNRKSNQLKLLNINSLKEHKKIYI